MNFAFNQPLQFLLFALAAIVTGVGADSCPPGWTYSQVFEQCYRPLTTANSTWSVAEAACKAQGGWNAHLASIQNGFQNAAIQSLISSMGPTCSSLYWIGANVVGNQLKWSSGLQANYSNFGPGQPNSTSNCVAFDVANSASWSTADCSVQKCAICQKPLYPADCYDWKMDKGATSDGQYKVVVNGANYTVSCDMTTNGGGWTVIQRRVDSTEPFWNRTWSDYKTGFGTLGAATNFWAGLELAHLLTMKNANVSARVELHNDRAPGSNYSNAFWFSEFTDFKILSESENYTVYMNQLWDNVIGNATSNWYDWTYANGTSFSTVDRINDPLRDSVTDWHLGGWWLHYGTFGTLNGEYIPPHAWADGYGLSWTVNGYYTINPARTYLAVRPILDGSA